MKKLFVIFCFTVTLFMGCSDNNTDTITTMDPELFVRKDAALTTIPLVFGYSWRYQILPVGDGKPDKFIKDLLLNSSIVEMKILPVREYDNNSGAGRYDYQSLCYITSTNIAFFYMDDKIYVGQYMYPDNYGLESVTWEFELPRRYTEHSSRYFTLNRNVSFDDPSVNKNENFLYEEPGFHTLDIEIDNINVRRHKDCKRFVFYNTRNSSDEHPRKNVFYFKESIGLIKYQQFLIVDATEALLYEQFLVEPL